MPSGADEKLYPEQTQPCSSSTPPFKLVAKERRGMKRGGESERKLNRITSFKYAE